MSIDVIGIAEIVLTVIGGATVMLNIFAPLTKNQTDDKVVAFLMKVLSVVSLNKDDSTIKIKVSKRE